MATSMLAKITRPGGLYLHVDCAKRPVPFGGEDRSRSLERVFLVEVEGVVHLGFRQKRGVHVD